MYIIATIASESATDREIDKRARSTLTRGPFCTSSSFVVIAVCNICDLKEEKGAHICSCLPLPGPTYIPLLSLQRTTCCQVPAEL